MPDHRAGPESEAILLPRALAQLTEEQRETFLLYYVQELSVPEAAGAVAWSGCHRGAFQKFAGRSAGGRCGDEADYIETAVLTSCMRPSELPVELWNALVQRCFGWAAEGSTQYKARCDAGPGRAAP